MSEQIEPIIAYRGWDTGQYGTLHAQGFNDEMWPIRKPASASCDQKTHAENAPAGGCTCGLYAFKDVETLHQVFATSDVVGRVALWGRIVEHEHGYRAEYAYPQILFYGEKPRQEERARKAAQLYGIDVLPLPKTVIEAIEAKNAERAAQAALLPVHPFSWRDLQAQIPISLNTSWYALMAPSWAFYKSEDYLKGMGFIPATEEEIKRYG